MKKRLLSLLCALVLFSSCAGNAPLYSIEAEGRVYEINGSKRRTVIVSEDGERLQKLKIKTDGSVGASDGSYGMEVLDLNFDGLADLKIAVSVNGELISEACYLQNPETGLYEKSPALAQLYTIGVVAEQKLVLSYFGVTEDPSSGVTTDAVVAYTWQGDGLIPYRKLTLTYYPATDLYCYGVADYIDTALAFDEPKENWLTPEKFEETDWGFFYYFR